MSTRSTDPRGEGARKTWPDAAAARTFAPRTLLGNESDPMEWPVSRRGKGEKAAIIARKQKGDLMRVSLGFHLIHSKKEEKGHRFVRACVHYAHAFLS
jgi:hypothetical protein